MDLSRVTFPTFVLEPRSMLERITDFMAHPDLLFGYAVSPSKDCAPSMDELILIRRTQCRKVQRSGGTFHPCSSVLPRRLAHQTQGCKEAVCITLCDLSSHLTTSPSYNPVLGEFFRCRYDYADGTQGFYIAEQGTPIFQAD